VPPAFTLVACSAYFSTLRMEAVFLRNVGRLSTDYMALYPSLWESQLQHLCLFYYWQFCFSRPCESFSNWSSRNDSAWKTPFRFLPQLRQPWFLFSNQLVNPATSSPANDVHHNDIPPKLLLTNRFYFQQTSGIHAPVGKRKDGSLSGRSPAPIADSSNVATSARKHCVLNLREIKRNNMHTALASVLTFYGWVSLNFSFFVVTQRNII
jgi:hypothetical protein